VYVHQDLVPRRAQIPDWLLASITGLIVLLVGYALLRYGRPIKGPFVLLDELEYFSYARDLHLRADLATHTQYGVLYPALASLIFPFGDAVSVYRVLRVLNVALLVSSAIPALLLARALLPATPLVWLFPIYVVTAPFSGFVYPIWAEPLYYALFLWTAFALFQFYRDITIHRGLLCGVLLGLLFHTKSGAGLIVMIAAFLTLAVVFGRTPSRSRRRLVAPIAVLILSCLALCVPWMVRNISLGSGLIGYSTGESELAVRLAEVGYLRFIQEVVSAAFYQVSYVFVGSWGLAGVVLVWPLMRWRSLSSEMLALMSFTIACVMGLIALSAIGMTAHRSLGYWIPNGRYYCILFPLILLVAIWILNSRTPAATRLEKSAMCGITVALAIVALVASPLRAAAPFSFVNNPELALPIWLLDAGQVIWRGSYEPTTLQSLYLAAGCCAAGLAAIWASRWPSVLIAVLTALFAGNLVVSAAEHRYVTMIASSQTGINEVVAFLARQSETRDTVLFDRGINNSNLEWFVRFWTSSDRVKYSEPSGLGTDGGRGEGRKIFVSSESLPFPVMFSSHGIYVYKVNHRSASPSGP
jgi:hypothetical protein